MTFFRPTNFVMLTGLLAVSSFAAAANTPAGTLITNQAAAAFDPVDGVTEARSNIVTTVVQAQCAVSVTSTNGGTAALLAGEQTTLSFTVTNSGNQAFDLPISASSSGQTPAPTLSIYNDLNGNGQLDANEPLVSDLKLDADATAKLIVVIQTNQSAQGNALINLVASCGAAGSDTASATGQVTLSPPPLLNVHKTFTPTLIKPGAETTVNVSTRNDGQGESREVVLTDMLTDEVAAGLSYVAGSAQTNMGTLEYTTDGTTWSSAAISPVRGIRVRVAKMLPGDQINLSFRMAADASAENKIIPNTATAETSGRTTSSTAQVDVRYQPGVALGPIGNPLAPEGTPEDSQTKPFAVVGQQICFDHTLQNTGDVRDTFQITVTYPQGAATSTLYGANGQPLVQPLPLDPGETALVRICYTPTQTGPLEALITATGARGESNTTKDIVQDIQNGLPELKKSYVATTLDENGQPKTLDAGTSVAVGDTITYTLSVHNPYSRVLTNVVITDPIPAHVDFVSANQGGVVSGTPGDQTVTWNVGTLGAGETRTYTIVTKVSDRSVDGENLKNVFNMVSSELPTPTPSNAVNTPVWNAKLIIQKDVSAKVVTYGDRLTYTLKITNASATTAIEKADVADTPAAGLQYIAGSSQLNGKPLADPSFSGSTMHWDAGTIPAGATITLTYDMRVTPQAASDLVNVVEVTGVGAGDAARAIASNRAQAITKLDPLKFAPVSDILGTVFVDRNRNGLYDAGIDTPIERARVILSGGRLALTDAAGRYHFSNVPYGAWALRLDPNTTPYPPLKLPQDGGLSGTQTVQVSGLTSVNFPLAPLGGDIAALRRTTLTMGNVTLEKAVYAVDGGYVVTLKITTPEALQGFELNDPLPGGATLKEGRNTLTSNLPAGETNLTYHFDWTGDPEGATTDPVMSWRY